MQAGSFLEISLILVVATGVAGFMQLLRQPIIIGHIITGLLVGPSILNLVHSTETFELFSRIGVALLLFIIGLGLNPRVVKEVGKVALATGLAQITITSVVGFGIATALGFSMVESVYMGVALCFSSTIIILKLLSDKKELNRLPGKVATGFLLVQDLVAVLILIFITALTQSGYVSAAQLALEVAIKGLVSAGVLAILAVYVVPRLSQLFARSQEFLFLFSVGWGLGIAALATLLGFSIEIGALAAGVSLAISPYSYEISSRMRPLRDFFIIIFFIVLGSRLGLENILGSILPAVALSVFVLVGNPIILMSVMGLLGYTKKTSFKVALTVGQISEFSLILILLGRQAGHIDENVASTMTVVGLITIAASTYMVIYSDELYKRFEPILGIFERSNVRLAKEKPAHYEIIMFGYIAGSEHFIRTFKKLGKRFLVVDYNPETIDYLRSKDIPCRYGDGNDSEFLEELDLESARLVVINVTEFVANKLIVRHVRAQSKRAIIIAMNRSDKIENSLELYEDGANYVMMPHHQTSIKVSTLISRHQFNHKNFDQLKAKQTQSLLREAS